jgi:membrane protein DedA with SNARE-associated domain
LKPSSLVFAGLIVVACFLFRRRLNRLQFAVAALAVIWLVLRGSGAIELPNVEKLARDAGPTLGAWTYLLVGAMAFLETAFFVGLIAPGEFTVILGGFIAGQGHVDVFLLAAIVFVCAAAGDTTSFVLGRRLGRGFLLRFGPQFGLSAKRLAEVERFFEGNAGKTILIGRFLGLVRALAPFLAGASLVSARRFLSFDYPAAAIWSATFVGLGYVFWQSFDSVVSFAKKGAYAFGAVVTLIALVVFLHRWLEEPDNRLRLRQAWRERSFKPLTRADEQP